MRICARTSVLCVVLLGATAAHAQTPPTEATAESDGRFKALAVSTFADGQVAFARGDFVAAGRAFEASHRHVPRAAAIYNAARAWDAAGDKARAADAFAIALDRTDLRGAEAAEASTRLRALDAELGIVTF